MSKQIIFLNKDKNVNDLFKGGAGSGGARTGAGRPKGSGKIPDGAVKIGEDIPGQVHFDEKGKVNETQNSKKFSDKFDEDLILARNELLVMAQSENSAKEFEINVSKGKFSSDIIFKKVRESFPDWNFEEQNKYTNILTGKQLVRLVNKEIGSRNKVNFDFEMFYNYANNKAESK